MAPVTDEFFVAVIANALWIRCVSSLVGLVLAVLKASNGGLKKENTARTNHTTSPATNPATDIAHRTASKPDCSHDAFASECPVAETCDA